MNIDTDHTAIEHPEIRPDILNPPAVVAQIDLSDESISLAFRASNQNFEQQLVRHISLLQQNQNPGGQPPAEVCPLPEGLDEKYYDGALIGADGRLYSSDREVSEVPPYYPPGLGPDSGIPPTIYINGILSSIPKANRHIRKLSRQLNAPVVGIYNLTESELDDVLQSIFDKFDLGSNPAAKTLQNTIEQALRLNQPLNIFAESQGAIIASRAISDAIENLKECGWSEHKILGRIARIQVETIGGAAWVYPDGPNYVHYVNEADPIPSYFGLNHFGMSSEEMNNARKDMLLPSWFESAVEAMTALELDRLQGIHPGKGARIIRFSDSANSHWLETHTLETYLRHHVDFELASTLPEAKPYASEHKPSYFRPLALIGSLLGAGLALRRWRKRRKVKKQTENS